MDGQFENAEFKSAPIDRSRRPWLFTSNSALSKMRLRLASSMDSLPVTEPPTPADATCGARLAAALRRAPAAAAELLARGVRRMKRPAFWGRPDDTKKTLPEEWQHIQSPWRYATGLFPYLGSPLFTLRRTVVPVLAVLAISVAVDLVWDLKQWQLDDKKYFDDMYRFSSFVLSLLLAFRANRTYDRWWQARCAWGGIGGNIVNVVRQVATWSDDPVLIRQFEKWGMALVYGMVQLINNTPTVTDPRVKLVLEPGELALYESTTKPSKLCGSMLSALIEKMGPSPQAPGLTPPERVMLNRMLAQIADNCSMVARIKLQAMPYGMSLFCTGWTTIWLLLLPFGIYPDASRTTMLPLFCMATMMLGLEDAAIQLEDPFKFFGYEPMVATTAKDIPRTVAEVHACKALIRVKYAPAMGQSPAPELPPFPKLPQMPQRGRRRGD